jgi:hypothetical protein
MDYFYFKGYSLHTGVYLIINIKYRFKNGSKPTMDLTGIRPMALKDIENMIGQGKVNTQEVTTSSGEKEQEPTQGKVQGSTNQGTGFELQSKPTDITDKSGDKE